jgi:hypothetical protein
LARAPDNQLLLGLLHMLRIKQINAWYWGDANWRTTRKTSSIASLITAHPTRTVLWPNPGTPVCDQPPDRWQSASRLPWFRSGSFISVSWRGMGDLEVKLQLFFRFHVVGWAKREIAYFPCHLVRFVRLNQPMQRVHLKVNPTSHIRLALRWRMCESVPPLSRTSFTSRLLYMNSKPVTSPNANVPVTVRGCLPVTSANRTMTLTCGSDKQNTCISR